MQACRVHTSTALQVLLRHMVSTHVRSAVHGIEASASMIQAVSNAYELWRKQIG